MRLPSFPPHHRKLPPRRLRPFPQKLWRPREYLVDHAYLSNKTAAWKRTPPWLPSPQLSGSFFSSPRSRLPHDAPVVAEGTRPLPFHRHEPTSPFLAQKRAGFGEESRLPFVSIKPCPFSPDGQAGLFSWRQPATLSKAFCWPFPPSSLSKIFLSVLRLSPSMDFRYFHRADISRWLLFSPLPREAA